MQEQIERNYSQIKNDVEQIIADEMERIKNDPELQHLLPPEDIGEAGENKAGVYSFRKDSHTPFGRMQGQTLRVS